MNTPAPGGDSTTGDRGRGDGDDKISLEPKDLGHPSGGVNVVRRVLFALGVLSVIGFGALVLTAVRNAEPPLVLIGTGLLVELAGIVGGAFIGFLFAIPRSSPSRAGDDAAVGGPGLVANTNLVEISDWLTKILVGVGLIQLGQISGGFTSLVGTVTADLGGGSGVSSVIGAMLVFSVTVGCMTGYLVTRTSLTLAFQEYGDLAGRVDKNSRTISQHSKEIDQLVKDQRAINAVESFLGGASVSGNGGLDPIDFKGVSSSTRARIFGRARRARRDNTLGRSGRAERLEAAAAVFQALAIADSQGQYHRNYGQLGYALKDLNPPKYAGALAALDEAIKIRDAQGVRGFRMYEFTRAVCKAGLDPAVDVGHSEPRYRDSVLRDLREGATEGRVRGDDFALINGNALLIGFLTRNEITLADVTR